MTEFNDLTKTAQDQNTYVLGAKDGDSNPALRYQLNNASMYNICEGCVSGDYSSFTMGANSSAIAVNVTAAVNANKVCYVPPGTWWVEDTVEIPPSVGVFMHGTLAKDATGGVYDGFPTMRIGTQGVTNNLNGYVMVLRAVNTHEGTQGSGSWEPSNGCIEMLSPHKADVHVPYTSGGEFGLWIHAYDEPAGYNKFTFGRHISHKYALKITSTSLGGWINENRYYGGTVGMSAGAHPGEARYGIYHEELTQESQQRFDSNRFYGWGFELWRDGQAIPYRFQNANGLRAYDTRIEECDADFVASFIGDKCKDNYIHCAYVDNSAVARPRYVNIEDSSTNRNVPCFIDTNDSQTVRDSNATWTTLWEIKDLHRKWGAIDSQNTESHREVIIPDIEAAWNSNTGGLSGTDIRISEVAENYITATNSGRGFSKRVKFGSGAGNRMLRVTTNVADDNRTPDPSSGSSIRGLLGVFCFDDLGNQIDDNDYPGECPSVTYGTRAQSVNGVYYVRGDYCNKDEILWFRGKTTGSAPAVAEVRLMWTPKNGTEAPQWTGFEIQALPGNQYSATNQDTEIVEDSVTTALHQGRREIRRGIDSPTAAGLTAYARQGDVIYNDADLSSGWRCTVGGTTPTWEEFTPEVWPRP